MPTNQRNRLTRPVGQFANWKTACVALLLGAATVISSPAQTFTILAAFDITNGAYPYGTLVQGLDGNFYGTTAEGGRQKCVGGCGIVFKITPEGALTTVHSFIGTDGGYPVAGLVLATNGNFYGSTHGTSPQGVNGSAQSYYFEITPAGTLTNLQGGGSLVALMQDTVDGSFYGTTGQVGAPLGGTVFAITTGGTMTLLHTFCQIKRCPDGANPVAPLAENTDNFLYGTTYYGGNVTQAPCLSGSGCGIVFKIGTKGALAIVHKFDGTDGEWPAAGLLHASDGNFYGTTTAGGAYGRGTVFRNVPEGSLTTLYSFCSEGVPCNDGYNPTAGLVPATDGNFYGTTEYGANQNCPSGCGTIFQLTPEGSLATVHSFDKTDGGYAQGGLVQGTDGNLYGTTTGFVGQHMYGTVFKLWLGLSAFVKTLPTAAYPGTTVEILGTNLTGATSVTFNGKTAAFTLISATEITTTVPKGSSTGTVQVTTPSGTLSSNIAFRVF
jgi:uncharacterized repeat protein (TIGR03803 family)